MNRYIIEKELCNPTDAYNIPGPYYHVVRVNEESGEREVLKTFDKHIEDAARYAQHELDVDVIETAYAQNPNAFKSTLDMPNVSEVKPAESYKGTVISVNNNFAIIKYKDLLNNDCLIKVTPVYKEGDEVIILISDNSQIVKITNWN